MQVTQKERMKKMLRDADEFGRKIPNVEFAMAGMLRYGQVKSQLEAYWFIIDCEPIIMGCGTWAYWLTYDPECDCEDAPLFCKVHKNTGRKHHV